VHCYSRRTLKRLHYLLHLNILIKNTTNSYSLKVISHHQHCFFKKKWFCESCKLFFFKKKSFFFSQIIKILGTWVLSIIICMGHWVVAPICILRGREWAITNYRTINQSQSQKLLYKEMQACYFYILSRVYLIAKGLTSSPFPEPRTNLFICDLLPPTCLVPQVPKMFKKSFLVKF
jgi:hypothetical protein